MKKSIITITIIISMLLTAKVYAGYKIVQLQTTMSGLDTSTILLEKNKYKIVNPAETVIIDFAHNRINLLRGQSKSYWEGTIEQYIKAITDMANVSKDRMMQAIKKLPKDQQEQIIEMHGLDVKEPHVKVSVKETNQAEKISGYNAQKFVVNANGMSYEEVWIARAIDIKKYIDPVKLQSFNAKIKKAAIGGTIAGDIGLSKPYMKLIELGYPVKVVSHNGMTTSVESVKKMNISNREFEIPSGYKRVQSLQEYFMSGHGAGMY
ncbi:MAG: DUF4412 domain-containing protein [Deltaproteobacteria bacterium]|nr:DUF4412 domain-containing protein [Deltaproteobacteria bacterium]MCL5791790.1 DUF4412 domain-containing protein [Deltaproteobacteria bacterium]